MGNYPTPVPQTANDEELDLSRILFLCIRKWYWFVTSVVLALAVAFFFNHYYRQQAYTIDTSILVMDKNPDITIATNMFEKSVVIPAHFSVILDNEIELLKSYTLNLRVFEHLNWRISWYKKEFFMRKDLYPNVPFIVQESEHATNLKGLILNLRLETDSTYTLSANGCVLKNNLPQSIQFEARGKFGEPFNNEYFHFTLYLKGNEAPSDVGDEFCFQFNNIHTLTLSYLKKLQIVPAGNHSNVVRLSIKGDEPLREIHYLNGLVKEYINLNLEFRTITQKRSLEFINQQLSGISDSLNEAGNSVTHFRSQNQVLNISTEGGLVMQQLIDIEKERSQTQMQLDYFLHLLAYLENSDSIQNMIMPSVVGIQFPSFNAIVLKLSDLYSKQAVLSFSTQANNPTLLLLNKEIDQLTSQLRENLINLISNSRLTIRNLQSRKAKITRQIVNLPVKEQQLIDVTRHYELTSEIYTYLLQKKAETDIALASTLSNIRVIDPARMERVEKAGISVQMLYFLAFILGLILPALVISGFNALNTTIQSQEDVERLTPVAIIGNVPHSSTDNELVVCKNPRAPIAEAYRTILTNLRYMFREKHPQVIGIHSVRPGEGKSISSVNLACILALKDKKILLIGADLRKPRLHQILSCSDEIGLSTYLIGKVKYEDMIQKTRIENLFLLLAGPIPPNPSELLERDLFKILIERARKEFDYIIVDNATMVVTEGLVTSQLTDVNIFILRCGVSRKDQLKFINDMVTREVIKHPALVINDFKGSRYGFGYHSYSYS